MRWRTLATTTVPIEMGRYPEQRYALVEASPETGRYRQIRKHFHQHVREEEQRILPLLDCSRLDQAALRLQIVACREAMLAAATGVVEEQVDD